MVKKIKRNELCPCGSGKKYKRCGYLKEAEERQKRREEFRKLLLGGGGR